MMCLFHSQLELTIDHLPPINEPLVCAFTTLDKPTIYTNATRKRNGVNCTTPRTDLLPQIAQGKRKFHIYLFRLFSNPVLFLKYTHSLTHTHAYTHIFQPSPNAARAMLMSVRWFVRSHFIRAKNEKMNAKKKNEKKKTAICRIENARTPFFRTNYRSTTWARIGEIGAE